jgi:DNA-binding transcriptional ArsR family regulator
MDTPSNEDFVAWATWFKCLADPTRLRILNFVSGLDAPATVGDIVDSLSLTQSNVSHHLGKLAGQGFVLLEQDGIRTFVQANPKCIVALPAAAKEIMRMERIPTET